MELLRELSNLREEAEEESRQVKDFGEKCYQWQYQSHRHFPQIAQLCKQLWEESQQLKKENERLKAWLADAGAEIRQAEQDYLDSLQ